MKPADFHIGLEFVAGAGFRWRCTDVGSRTILAIRLDRNDTNWYQGPPYIAKEVVFDEHDLARCHPTNADALSAAATERQTSAHPGYSSAALTHMLKVRRAHAYPYPGVLRFDRRRTDGEILHPFAGRQEEGEWVVELYLPFQDAYEVMTERDFIALPRATSADLRSRAVTQNTRR
ncbi:hypothetical protein DVT68_07355 [Dyella solisilvae]|uniref:Uncharacterized protein n=1 Tax=Dyella solisilvae TaxID=1920168 RepID=A0A370K6T1_9GAMM|nr:hypothetical protein [Dyella solisilvae]RDI98355.1 hypothetical protein DVT68_07355 [Dyella solisilvae]